MPAFYKRSVVAFLGLLTLVFLGGCDLLGGMPEMPEMPEAPEAPEVELPEGEIPEGELPEGVGVGAGEGPGPDIHRNVSIPIPPEEFTDDQISYDGDDLIDWKKVFFEDATQIVVVLAADEADAEVAISVFDTHGLPLGRAVRALGSKEPVEIHIAGAQKGRIFLKIEALDGPTTLYQVKVATVGGGGGSKKDDDSSDRPGF